MATAIATASGNFTTAATWATVDATSLLHSEANTTTLTTAYVESSTFTPGAITIDGIAVKVGGRATSATGTMSVRLAQGGATVAGTEVTINVSDIPKANALVADTANGWILVKFAAPVVLLAATLYTVSAKTSSASMVALYRDATAANWSRMLRTTTTAALAAGDNWYILGEWTAAATKTNRSVTMDQTATTDYGGASTTIQSFGIGVGGTLTWGTTAATAYILRLSGILIIHTGGTYAMGTDPDSAGTAIPRDSSAELQFDSAADGDFGFILWGTFVTQGLSRTLSKNVVQCLLNTDEAIGQTVLGVDTDTGWLNGDEIAIASTTQTATQAETGTLSGAAAASSVTISVAITAAHSGTSPNQAEVILITRNVRIVAVTTTAVWYGTINAGAVINCAWTQFRYFGTGLFAKSAAFYIQGAITSFTNEFCAYANGEANGVVVTASGTGTGVTFNWSDCTFYAVGVGATSLDVIRVETSAGGTYTMTRCGCIFDSNTSSSWGFFDCSSSNVTSLTFDTCRVNSGLGCAINFNNALAYSIPKIITGCVFHCLGGSSGTSPVHFQPGANTLNGVYIFNTQFRRCPVTAAAQGAITIGNGVGDVTIEDCTFVANANGGICFAGSSPQTRVLDSVFAGDASFTQTAGVFFGTANKSYMGIRFDNCTFGVGTAHATSDINAVSWNANYLELTLVNCNLASGTEFTAAITTGGVTGNVLGRSWITRHRKDTTTNTHEKVYINLGTVAYESATFRTAAPAEKLTPTGGSSTMFKLRSSPKRIPVLIGDAVTASCYVRKDATYNGNQPRLVMLANPALGLDADLVLDTMTGSHSAWEQLTGTQTPVAEEDGVVEVVVEVDGTAGNAYVDDWSASSA